MSAQTLGFAVQPDDRPLLDELVAYFGEATQAPTASESSWPPPSSRSGYPAYAELAADQATARRAARIEARPFGQVIWLQLWGGLTSGALLADVYQADAKDGVVGSRRYLMNGLMGGVMDGSIAGHLLGAAFSCTPIDASPDLYACASGEGGGMNNHHGISGTHTLLSVVNAGEEGLGLGVRLTRRVGLGG